MERYDFWIRCGESLQQTIRFRNEDGSAVDLSGRRGHCQVRKTPRDRNLLLSADVRIIPEEGYVSLWIPASATAGLEPGVYAYDFCLETEGSGEVRYYIGGRFNLLPSVTKLSEGE